MWNKQMKIAGEPTKSTRDNSKFSDSTILSLIKRTKYEYIDIL